MVPKVNKLLFYSLSPSLLALRCVLMFIDYLIFLVV